MHRASFLVTCLALIFSIFNEIGAQAVTSGQTYYIHPSSALNESLDAWGYGTSSPTPIYLYNTKTSATLNENWMFVATGDSNASGPFYYIYTAYSKSMVLDVANGSTVDGTTVRGFAFNGSPAQKWQVIDQGNGFFRLKPMCAPGSSLDLNNNDTTPGKFQMQIWTDITQDPGQWWQVLPTVQTTNDLVVAVDGSDTTGNGSLNQPFKTLDKARQFIASTGRNRNMTYSFNVFLRQGTYTLSSPLTFGASDSGSNGFKINYASYPYESATISGGRQITGWSQYQGAIYKASAQGLNFRQLYVNGKRATLSRYPNKRSDTDLGGYLYTQNWDDAANQLLVNAGDINTGWSGINSTLEVVLKMAWQVSTLRVASVSKTYATNSSTAHISFMSPESGGPWSSSNGGRYGYQKYYFQNSLSLLTDWQCPGQWFLDTVANVVYYIPRAGENISTAQIIAPVVSPNLININGSTNLEFSWLTFSHCGYILDNNLRMDSQNGIRFTAGSNYKQFQTLPGAICLTNASNIVLSHDTITHMGGTGIQLAYGTTSNTVDSCNINDIGNNGIDVYTDLANNNFNPSDPHKCRYDTISNNYISYVGREFEDACGVSATFPKGLTVTHNEIAYCPAGGICLGYAGWAAANALQSNVITFNNVHDATEFPDDMGDIYTQAWNNSTGLGGTTISNNWVHDTHHGYWGDHKDGSAPAGGFYLDNCSTGISCTNNYVSNTDTYFAVNTGQGADQSDFNPGSNFNYAPSNTSLYGPQTLPEAIVAPSDQGSRPGYQGTGPLLAGDYLQSQSGLYFTLMQSDGNLVDYKGVGPWNILGGIWASNTGGHTSGAFETYVQSDNLCIYQTSPTFTNLRGYGAFPSSNYYLTMQDDNNLVLYKGFGPYENYGWTWDKNVNP